MPTFKGCSYTDGCFQYRLQSALRGQEKYLKSSRENCRTHFLLLDNWQANQHLSKVGSFVEKELIAGPLCQTAVVLAIAEFQCVFFVFYLTLQCPHRYVPCSSPGVIWDGLKHSVTQSTSTQIQKMDGCPGCRWESFSQQLNELLFSRVSRDFDLSVVSTIWYPLCRSGKSEGVTKTQTAECAKPNSLTQLLKQSGQRKPEAEYIIHT